MRRRRRGCELNSATGGAEFRMEVCMSDLVGGQWVMISNVVFRFCAGCFSHICWFFGVIFSGRVDFWVSVFKK